MRVLSGVQPTGNLHLGNYLGAIKQFVALKDQGHGHGSVWVVKVDENHAAAAALKVVVGDDDAGRR